MKILRENIAEETGSTKIVKRPVNDSAVNANEDQL